MSDNRSDGILQAIADGISGAVGKDFFETLVCNLAITLNVAYVSVGEKRGNRIRTVARSAHGRPAENIEYDLAGTPCERVISGELCVFPADVWRQFPEDRPLKEMAVESYIGVPLLDSSDQPMGQIVVMNTVPITDSEPMVAAMRIFAARAAAELERKQAEETLRNSEARLRAVMDNSPVSINLKDLDGRYVIVNKAFLDRHRLKVDEVIGKTIHEIKEMEDAEEIFAQERIVRTTRESQTFENTRNIDGNGELTLKVIRFPVIIEDSRLSGIGCMSIDITEQKRGEEVLRYGEQWFRHLYERAPLGYQSLDEHGCFIEVNQAWLDMIGCTREEVIDRSFGEFIAPAYQDLFMSNFPRFKKAGETQVEFEMLRKNGERVMVSFAGRIGYDEAGRFKQTHCILTDITERKRTEEALAIRTALLDATQRLTKVGGWQYDVIRQTIVWTDELYRIHGFAPDTIEPGSTEHIERSIECYAPEDRPTILAAFERCVAEGEPYDLEFPFTAVDGSQKWIRTAAQAIWEQDRIVRVIGDVVDVTEHKKAEETLRQSEEHLLRAESLAHMGHWRFSLDDEVLDLSPELCRLFGYDPATYRPTVEESISRYHPDDQDEVKRLVGASIETGQGFEFGVRMIRTDGAVRDVYAKGECEFGEDGNVIALFGVFQDITEDKQAEKALRESEEKYRRIINTTSEGYWLSDPDFKTLEVNDAICEILGYSRDEMLGKTAFDFADEENRTIIAKQAATREEVDHRIFEMTFKAKDGRDVRMHVNATSIRDTAGKLIGSFAFLTDMTESKRIEQQLIQTQKMEAVGVLAGGVAHDFNNIVTGIMGHCFLALNKVPEGHAARGSLEQIEGAGKRATNLVQQLLAFSRRRKADRQLVNLHDVVGEVIDLIRASVPSTIRIGTSFDGLPGSISADSTQLHQVLMNLCSNSADAIGGDTGIIEVGVKTVDVGRNGDLSGQDLPAGKYVKLTVADNGSGMDKGTEERMFDPFFTTKTVGKGTGLGLSAVHGIIGEHEGIVRVDSMPGEGTTISIFFPRLDEVDRSQAAELVTGVSASGTERVLLVDDDKIVLNVISSLLGEQGYMIDAVSDSVAALSVFRVKPHKFDLVITDQIMPEMTGDVLARKLLAISPEIPIILCTGYQEALSEDVARDIGIREIVLKPVDPINFPHLVRRILDRDRQKG